MAKKLAGVMGDPISHSLSPKMHGYWIEQLAIDAAYLPYHVTADDLQDALKALPKLGIAGVNLTIPHKQSAFEFMDEVSEIAKQMGAINTVKVLPDGKLYGTNTDGAGFINNLKQYCQTLEPYLQHCFILGAGGAAQAIAVALKQAGAKRISISNRSAQKADQLAKMIGAKSVSWESKAQALADVTMLVNTTSLGMQNQPALNMPLNVLPKTALVTDIVYTPLLTPLLHSAKHRGNLVVTGLGMLVHQAIDGFEMWFGTRPTPTDELYAMLEAQLCE